jgi:putative Holliday junction resolvase
MGNKRLMRTMGLDIGTHTIGIAISDELGITAQGLKTLRRKSMEEDFREIATIINQFEIQKIVVGLPKNMNGTLGKQAEIVLKWIKILMEKVHIPVVTWDERLSTVGASKVLLEADLSRRKRKKVIDKLAAVLILQGYLDQSRRANHGTLFQE